MGGLRNGRGGVCEVLTQKKGVSDQVSVLAMLKGGRRHKIFGVVFTR